MNPMNIHELFVRDPLETGLANRGQSQIAAGTDDKIISELREELKTFVCEGQFRHALTLVLQRYMEALEADRQDAAWVSGFFGSGKSHLLKMLAHIWRDTRFADGATARGLVLGLPDSVRDLLRELDGAAKRFGSKPCAAEGSLLSGTGHVRLSVLQVILRACDLPEQYPQASFALWLKRNGYFDQVKEAVEAAGRDWESELNFMFISNYIAEALIQVDPTFAEDVGGAKQYLSSQYQRPKEDVTTETFVETARQALQVDGEIPPTILVLDEVQQYVNEDGNRATTFADLAAVIQTRFDSRILLVASGQSALAAGTPNLDHLTGRFRITVQLTDAEVEKVTQAVLLRKRPEAVPPIQEMLQAHAGEVARHLQGTKLAARPEDDEDLLADYPLLRTRRRFWEACFHATDTAGTASQLRSQLRILYDSLRNLARRPLGAVIPASDIYRALAPDFVAAGVLLPGVHTSISKLDDGTKLGALRADICGLVFLIGRLPRESDADAGLRATAGTLADLLVDDLTEDSGALRNAVAAQLGELVREGILLELAEEFRIQTPEGASWESAYREAVRGVNEVDVSALRDQVLRAAVQRTVERVRPTQGAAKLRRRLVLRLGATESEGAAPDTIAVHLFDEWSTSRSKVLDRAQRMGAGHPDIHVFIPRKSADEFRARIVRTAAAQRVIEAKGVVASLEGNEAREGMKSRYEGAKAERDRIVESVVQAAVVLQGGGTEIYGDNLASKLEQAVAASMVRLFPSFDEADHAGWPHAFKRARDGSDEPFTAVDWQDPAADHPVSKRVLETIGSALPGTKIRKELEASPYGWPRDAINAALVALHGSGHVVAVLDGRAVQTRELDQKRIGRCQFRPEKVVLTGQQRVKIRGILGTLLGSVKRGEASARAPEFLSALSALAQSAGGDAPLPPSPETSVLAELSRLTGNEQLRGILEAESDINAWREDWKRLADLATSRLERWELAEALCRHAEGDADVGATACRELAAVRAQRSLLEDDDPVAPWLAQVASILRQRLAERFTALAKAMAAADEQLSADTFWAKLDEKDRDSIRATVALVPPEPPMVETDAALRNALDQRNLAGWQSEIDAVPARIGKALQEAAEKSTNAAVRAVNVRRGLLKSPDEVQAWVAEHNERLLEEVAKGPVIVK